MKIYLIAYVYRSDDHYDDRSVTIEEDYGYFTTREAAEAFVASKTEDVRPAYDGYVARLEEFNAKAEAHFTERVEYYERLKAAGLENGPGVKKPVKANTERIKSYEEYRRDRYSQEYDIVEVEPANG